VIELAAVVLPHSSSVPAHCPEIKQLTIFSVKDGGRIYSSPKQYSTDASPVPGNLPTVGGKISLTVTDSGDDLQLAVEPLN
jgi:hypothetical protein